MVKQSWLRDPVRRRSAISSRTIASTAAAVRASLRIGSQRPRGAVERMPTPRKLGLSVTAQSASIARSKRCIRSGFETPKITVIITSSESCPPIALNSTGLPSGHSAILRFS